MAQSRDLAGSAVNRPDGAVEAVFEGSPDAVEAILDFCRVGPSGARVDRVDVREEPPEGRRGFRIG